MPRELPNHYFTPRIEIFFKKFLWTIERETKFLFCKIGRQKMTQMLAVLTRAF